METFLVYCFLVLCMTSSGETDYSELEEYAEEGDLKSKEALRSFEKLCLLYHECSGLQEVTPFVLQSFQFIF
jgi:hypothetical protein